MIHSFTFAKKNIKEVGEVIKSDRSIAYLSDLPNAVLGESVSFASGAHGVITKLAPNHVEAMIFSNHPLPVGESVARTGHPLQISVGQGMLGDTFDALGHITSVDKELSPDSENRVIEVDAPSLESRAPINQFFSTGVTLVDTVIPIAKGQRELIIGDQKTGKTDFALRVIKTQAKLGTICIVALIGKEQSEITRIQLELTKAGVIDKCIIVAEPARSSAARLTFVPFTAMTIAEHFRDQGLDTVVIIDDLSHHAIRYREMALLSDRFPGRDSYPSDIFYLHARLLERAGSFMIKGKPVNITCLPVVTTVDGDISGYIQTNIMSMTDGHLYFDKNLFFDGIRPSINIFLSVTRVGRQTQSKIAREIGQKILSSFIEYNEFKRFLRFGTELTDRIKESIRLARGIIEALKQSGQVSILPQVQMWLFALLWAGKWDGSQVEVKADKIQSNLKTLTKITKLVNASPSFTDLISRI